MPTSSSHRTIPLSIGADHAASLTKASPREALLELIWNGLDAGGRGVQVDFRRDDLGGITEIDVMDGGVGIDEQEVDRAFGFAGQSLKLSRRETPEGRAVHGRHGRGRFKSLALAPSAEWTSYPAGVDPPRMLQVTLRRAAECEVPILVRPEAPKQEWRTRVRLVGVDADVRSFDAAPFRSYVTEELSVYLSAYPDVVVEIDGRKIDRRAAVEREDSIDIPASAELPQGARVTIVEWTFKPESRQLHICDARGFSWNKVPLGVQTPNLRVTVYASVPDAADWAKDGRFALAELDPVVESLVESVKAVVRTYVRRRQEELAGGVVREWKAAGIYPFPKSSSPTPMEQAQQEVFDAVAVRLNEIHPTFEKADTENKRLSLALIRAAVEQSPSQLRRILGTIIDLSPDEQAKMSELLDRTTLPAIVRASARVMDRLDTVLEFEHLLNDTDWRRRLLERTQLHRLLVREAWIMGDEYDVASDDVGLDAVLSAHIKYMGRSHVAEEVRVDAIDRPELIPDLMFGVRRHLYDGHFEQLVVELKRPSKRIDADATHQLERYADAVSRDPRFDTRLCRWRFVVIGTAFDEFVKGKATSKDRPVGCIGTVGDSIPCFAWTWAEVLARARARHEWFRAQLDLKAQIAKANPKLVTRYPHILNGDGMRKNRDLAELPLSNG